MKEDDQFIPSSTQKKARNILLTVDVLRYSQAALSYTLSFGLERALGHLFGSCLFGSSSTIVLNCPEQLSKLIKCALFEFVTKRCIQFVSVVSRVARNEDDLVLNLKEST